MIVLLIAALAIARPGRAPVPSALPTGSGGLVPAATSTAAPSAGGDGHARSDRRHLAHLEPSPHTSRDRRSARDR